MRLKNENLVVAFDVDGTLLCSGYIKSQGEEDTPRYDIINLFLAFQKLGCHMIVWSGGGKEYAEGWCRRLNLKPNEIMCKTNDFKPDLCFDDIGDFNLGKVNIVV